MRQNKVVVVEGNISDIFIHAFTKERIKHIGMIKSKGEEKKRAQKRVARYERLGRQGGSLFFFSPLNFMFFFAAAQTTPGPSAPLFSLFSQVFSSF